MQYKDLVLVLRDEWLPFDTKKVSGLDAVWISAGVNADKASFAQQFSFADPDTDCLNKLNFNQDETLQLLAERYGGKGIGHNGGGARCGTYGNYQLKGIGANMLVGDHNDLVHSYGGLDARSAICEVVFTNVLSKVLPLGVIDIHGIIFTGVDTAIDPISKEKCWGAILVREACIRPAHFLPSTDFWPRAEHQKRLRSDYARTKIVNQNLAKKFASPNEFIMFLGSFLSKCANQMAFARVARIMHSTLSPSNFSIDGRWLDVSLSSFVGGGENYGLSSIFYNEASEPLLYCIELLEVYGKMNDLLLSPNSLISYYEGQFSAYCGFHLGYVFGLPFEKLNDEHKQDLDLFKSFAMKVINSGKYVNHHYAEPNPDDPVANLILGVFISLVDESEGLKLVEHAGLKKLDAVQIVAAFKNLTQALEIDFVIKCGMLAIKRAVLPGMFYLSLVNKEISELCNNSDPSEITSIIEFYDKAADWVFDYKNNENITIFRSESFLIEFMDTSNEFIVSELIKSQVSKFDALSDTLHYAEKLFDFSNIKMKGFFYKNYFNKLSNLSRYLCPRSKSMEANYAAE